MAKNKTRLDVALVEKGLAESREKAKAIIMSGIVYVNNQNLIKQARTLVRMIQSKFVVKL